MIPVLTETAKIRLSVFFIVLFAWVAYGNSFQVPFVFDDYPTILENPTIRQLWPLSESLFPPPNSGVTTSGRPLANLSLAISYAIGGFHVFGYHVFNFGIHLAAAFVLFGIVRRTLGQPILGTRFGSARLWLAFVSAALWAAHPLTTAAVTYIVQRAESICALFYLLAIYGFIRGTSEKDTSGWLIVSILSCYLSVASKEVGATIVLVIFLYDRTFVGGSFRKTWTSRKSYFLALLMSWFIQFLLILSTGNRGGTVGAGARMSSWDYALTQTWAISNYLKLTFWPSPLIFDYGPITTTHFSDVALPILVLTVLVVLTVLALCKRPVLGFPAAFFFIVLAPTSSFVPVVTQTIAEHRMYLPLTALIAWFVAALYYYLGRKSVWIFILLLIVATELTHLRNQDYRSHLNIWRDTAEKRPENPRAWHSVGVLLGQIEDYPLAIKMYDNAKKLTPRDFNLYFNTAVAFTKLGRVPEAVAEYRQAIALKPDYPEARTNLANILMQTGQVQEAIEQYKLAIRSGADSARAQFNLGRSLIKVGRKSEARKHLEASLKLQPGYPDALEALAALQTEQSKENSEAGKEAHGP